MRKIFAFVFVLALAACQENREEVVAVKSQTLSTPSCMQDSWQQHGNTQVLGCSANDVRVASAGNIRDVNGQPLTSCIAGTYFSFVADFTVNLTAQTRYDLGLYFAVDGDSNHDGALTGACDVSVVNAQNSPNFVQLDSAPDVCGDIDAAHNPQIVTVQVDNVLCQDNDASGTLDLPNCTSWRQSGSNEICLGAGDAYPGAPSKCNCDIGFDVPIAVAPPQAAVTKSFVALLCSTARFGVLVKNDSLTSTLTLTQLVDSNFGDLMSVHDSVQTTTCVSSSLPAGGTYACTFDALFCGGSETDTVTATLTDGLGASIERASNTLVVSVSASAN